MEDIDIALIKKKSLTGVVALTSRTFLLQLITFAGGLLLTILLSPQIYGVYFIVQAMISVLGYFADIGLAAALIQKKEALTQEDLATTFTIQQILVGSAVVLALLFSGAIASFYHLNVSGLWLLRTLIFCFFLSSLTTIPSILLERKLAFDKLVIPQVIQTIGFNAVAVILAWRGFGVASFTWAVLVRDIVYLVAMYSISPWHISWRINRDVAKRLLSFGVPFQLNGFIALVKDDLLVAFLGKVLPLAQVGYIGWAKNWAEVPLRLIMDSVIRVTFPAFARLQEWKEHLRAAIEKTLFGLSVSMFPISIGLLFFVQPLTEIYPKYAKWDPALFSFYIFTLGAIFAGLTTPLTNALNAIGNIKVTLWLMVMWTIIEWAFVLPAIHFFGFNGVSEALLLVNLTIIIVIYLVKKYVPFAFWRSIIWPLVAAVVQAGLYFGLLRLVPHTIPWLVAVGATGVILYASIIWAAEHKRIMDTAQSFFSKT